MRLEGSIVALITPMDDSGAVDYANLDRLIEFHIKNGTNAIVAVGTTGESATLSVKEHLAVIEYAIQCIAGRVPLVAGTGANSTKEAIFLTRQAADLGADAALIVVPYYNKPGQEGLYQHYKSIAEACEIPQYLYNVPGRTAADLSNETIARLSKIKNIVGCKDATGDMARGEQLLALCDSEFTILSGDDATALQYMKLGARGDISVTANVAPKKMQQMCQAALHNDYTTAEALNSQLQLLHRDLFIESNPIPVKYAVSKLGFTKNVLRLPLTSLAAAHEDAVDRAMQLALNEH